MSFSRHLDLITHHAAPCANVSCPKKKSRSQFKSGGWRWRRRNAGTLLLLSKDPLKRKARRNVDARVCALPRKKECSEALRIQHLSLGDGTSTTSAGVIDTRTLGKPKSFTGQTAEWTARQFTFKAYVCAAHPRMKEVIDFPLREGSEPVVNSDMTAELESPSTQLYHMLVMMLNDLALETVRNSPKGMGAEVCRKLL